MEIIFLIFLIVIALILLIVGIWLVWKLLGLLGSAILWLSRRIGEKAQASSIARKEAELARPPLISTSWGATFRRRPQRAFRQAAGQTTPEAIRLVVVAGTGFADLCRSLGITPPGAGRICLAVGNDLILIDASQANPRELKQLGRMLPWRRPLDGIAILASSDGLPPEGLARAAILARATDMKAALHLVLPSSSTTTAWRIIDSTSSSGEAVCAQLTADSIRSWLMGGERKGFEDLALMQSRELPVAIDRAIAIAPSSNLDIASLSFAGTGMLAAASQAVGRTRPSTLPGTSTGIAYTAFAIGVALAALAAFRVVDQSETLRTSITLAEREAAVPWTAEGVEAVPNGARVRRLAQIGTRLANQSDFSLLTPMGPLVPNWSSPAQLGEALLTGYVLRPLGSSLQQRALVRLEPRPDAELWLDDTRVVGEWLAAWNGLADDPSEVDTPALLSAAFDGSAEAWPEDIDIALVAVGSPLPSAETGGLDVDRINDLAKTNFILTMQNWATEQYTNGPIARASRRASSGGIRWREQYMAMRDLRDALQDPSQQWLTAAEDRSDHAVELRLLGRALALQPIGEVATIRAKAEVASIRIEAREMATNFVVPGIGALLERSGASSGPSLRMTAPASAWLGFLDRIANANFALEEEDLTKNPVLSGLVTIDQAAVAAARDRLRVFDRFAANLSPDIPATPARILVNELGAELVVGIAVEVERALRRENTIGLAIARAERRAEATAALQDLQEIENWLRDRQALPEADRVKRVHARVAEGILTAAAGVLDEEDPLAVYVDPSADGDALVRRFERGVQHMQRIHEQFVQQFLATVSSEVGGWAALHWQDMSGDIEGYSRGDPQSMLTTLEGSVRAFAESNAEICNSPMPLRGSGRGDYLVQAVNRFRSQLDSYCEDVLYEQAMGVFNDVATYYYDFVREYWPYAEDANAPEIGIPILGEFVQRLQASTEALEQVNEPLATMFLDSADLWSLEDESAVIRFELEWRTNPKEEILAEHVAEASVEGIELGDDGVHTWHYGAPFRFRLRIADDSQYRFLQPDGRLTNTWTISPQGRGSLIRSLEWISGGNLLLTAEVVLEDETDAAGATPADQLQISLRMTRPDGRGLTIPNFQSGLR